MRTLFLTLLLIPKFTEAAIPKVLSAEGVKRNVYLSDAVFSGGDSQADPVHLSGFRWANNPAGYERIVIDLVGDGSGWEKKAPPYFQVSFDEKTSSIQLSVRGVSERLVSTSTATKSVAKSSLLSQVYITPPVEGDLATMEVKTRAPVELESFYLVSPPRIVVDVRAKN